MGAVFRWIKYIYEWCKDFLSQISGEIDVLAGFGNTVTYHVSKEGLDTNDGLSWEKAFLTIQVGLDAVGDLGERGKGIVLVAPGAYSEDLTTPTNDEAPFGALIAMSPTDISHGAVYVDSGDADTPWLTVLARGWRISGFEIDCPTAEAGIKLDSTNGNAAYTQIDHCHFTSGLYGIEAIGAPPYVTIKDNLFSLMAGVGSRAITATAGINCNVWHIENNVFVACRIPIYITGAQAAQSFTIIRNTFHYRWSPGGTADQMIVLGGEANIVSKNVLGGTYTIAGGYVGSATDDWFGNFADVAGGVTRDNPA